MEIRKWFQLIDNNLHIIFWETHINGQKKDQKTVKHDTQEIRRIVISFKLGNNTNQKSEA